MLGAANEIAKIIAGLNWFSKHSQHAIGQRYSPALDFELVLLGLAQNKQAITQ